METSKLKIIVVMMLAASLTGFAADIYIPSFFTISQDLGSSISHVQQSMGIFLFAVSISQLIYGPISEIIGRRIPLVMGLIIALIGSLICYSANNINMLLVGRLIQGAGAGACACLWRAILKDSLSHDEISKYAGYLGIIMVFVVAASPALGGLMESYLNWKYSLLIVVIYIFITLILVLWYLSETNIHHHNNKMSFAFFKNAFGSLLSSRIFMGYTLCVFLTYGAFFSWFVMGPVLLIGQIGVKPDVFGVINLVIGGSAMALGGLLNGKIVGKLGKSFMLLLGWGLIFSAGMMILIWNIFWPQTATSLVAFVFIFLFGATFIWPNAFTEAFAPFAKIAGCASTLYSMMQLGGGAVIGSLSSLLPKSSNSLAVIFILSSVGALAIFEFWIKREEDN
jgi:Bcr/CflA subfamily drug resistance transporter